MQTYELFIVYIHVTCVYIYILVDLDYNQTILGFVGALNKKYAIKDRSSFCVLVLEQETRTQNCVIFNKSK